MLELDLLELDLPLDLLDFSELDFWEPVFSLDLSVDLPELFSVDFPEDFSLDFPVDPLADAESLDVADVADSDAVAEPVSEPAPADSLAAASAVLSAALSAALSAGCGSGRFSGFEQPATPKAMTALMPSVRASFRA